jgi:antitoxin PrlF
MAAILELEATVTERGQTTVPAAIRRMLALGKRDAIVFRGMPDGTVVIAKKESSEADDPALGRFLAFLESDIATHPHAIRPVSAKLLREAKELVAGVDVGDIDAPLPEDDA